MSPKSLSQTLNRVLYVGDPHAKISNLEEAKKLILFIYDTAEKEQVNYVCFLGDLFHNHAVLRLEIIHFWTWAFLEAIKRKIKVIALTGNHDKPGSIEKEHMSALNVYKYWNSEYLTIVDEPQIIENIAFIPYYHDEAEVVAHAQNLFNQGANQCAILHQTMEASKYENGFYAQDAMDSALFPQLQLIVGHIHSMQEFGKTWHPGTPKWDTMSDANKQKGIWVAEHNSDGSYNQKNRKFFSTHEVCQPIKTFTMTEAALSIIPPMDSKDRNHITLVGSSDWIKKIKKKIGNLASVKSKPTDSLSSKLTSKEKLVSIDEFLKDFEFQKDVDRNRVLTFIKNLESVA